MPEYSVDSYEIKPIEGDNQIELIIVASDGSRWEYGIPYVPSSGRYMFEELDVIEMDFGDEFAEKLRDDIEALVKTLMD